MTDPHDKYMSTLFSEYIQMEYFINLDTPPPPNTLKWKMISDFKNL